MIGNICPRNKPCRMHRQACPDVSGHSTSLHPQKLSGTIKLVVLLFLVQFVQGNGPGKRVNFSVVEEQKLGTEVGRVKTEPGYSYSFSVPNRYFHIEGKTGRITTSVKLDRENLTSDKVDILILGHHSSMSKAMIPLEATITILDINDHSPTFPNPSITVSFQEDANSNTQKLIDAAIDKDLGANGTVSNYKIISGNDDDKFKLLALTSTSIYLSPKSALNREDMAKYNLTIKVQDGGSPPRHGFLNIRVIITDINDNPPLFDLSDYTSEVNENIQMGSEVTQVRASDADTGLNAEFYYHISDDTKQFAINRTTGVIFTLVDKLECSHACVTCRPLSCFMTVTADDRGNPSLSGRAYVTVYLLDENDHAPVIKFHHLPDPTKSYSTVEEDAINKVVALVTVTDADYGINSETSLTIADGNQLGHFYMQSRSINLIRVKSRLDRSKVNKYNLTLIARDKGKPVRSSTANLIIFIKDVNKNAPKFEKDQYYATLHENVPAGSFVKSVVARDSDGNNSPLKYTVVSGNTNGWFAINEKTGLVLTAKTLDYEQKLQVVLNISAKDSGLTPQRNYTTLTVDIVDENDVAPVFSTSPLTISIVEGSKATITALTATDPEVGSFGIVSYRLAPQTKQTYPGMFDINTATGSIALLKALDREKIARFVVEVIATDQGSPRLSSIGTLTIDVTDINDNSPVMYPTEYYVRSTPTNHKLENLVMVKATDADIGLNAEVVYFIVRGDTHLFKVDKVTGWVSSVDGLSEGQYQLKVVAKDRGTSERTSLMADVYIIIKTDLSSITFNGMPYNFTVTEDFNSSTNNIGRRIGTISAASTSQTKISYRISSGDQFGVFKIHNVSGDITSSKVIDRESNPMFDLIVVASDGLNYESTAVHVTIRDVNDNSPQFPRAVVFVDINENWAVGHCVAIGGARDVDVGNNGQISYSATITDDIVKIDTKSGLISINKPQFSFVRQDRVMYIVAEDNGTPRLSSSSSIKFVVNDVNDHTPSFSHQNYKISLKESININTKFFQLSAMDIDYGLNSDIYYGISRGNDGNKFDILPDGWLYVAQKLDREAYDMFMLTVVASDRGTPSRSSSTNVTIYVADVNDNAPAFVQISFSFMIEENMRPKSHIGTVSATDKDLGKNSDLTFSCEDNSNFEVNPFSGAILTMKAFDREELWEGTGNDYLMLKITVTDHGYPQLNDTVTIKVTIKDINDNGPTFTKQNYYAGVNENRALNEIVLTVKAIDRDTLENGRIKYSLPDVGSGMFAIDAHSGDITLAKKLDREQVDGYILNVTAVNDAEGVTYTAVSRVLITVEDDNDHYPKFSSKRDNVDLSEATKPGEFLAQFIASDSDLGLNASIWYSITLGNPQGFFRIDKFSGKLYLARSVDYEKQHGFVINVTASDYGSPSLSVSTTVHIRLLDVNDNPPVFRNVPSVYDIREGASSRRIVTRIAITDPDEISAGKLEYFLARQSPVDGLFEIDARTGEIFAKPNIDREISDSFDLTVVVLDKGGVEKDWKLAVKNVTITITDVNDNKPVFLSSTVVGFDIKTTPGAKIASVSAIDADSGGNGEVAYEITSGNTNLFRIDPRDGNLYLKSSLFEQQTVQTISITARDKGFTDTLGQKSTTVAMTMFIYDDSVTDTAFSFDNTRYSGTIRENQAPGTSIVSLRTTSSSVAFYVTSITSGNVPQPILFDVDKVSGEITNSAIIDREQFPGPFTLDVVGIDATGASRKRMTAKVQITVVDENDTPPHFVNTPSFLRVSESHPTGRTVTILTAADPDTTGQLSFTLLSASHAGIFAVDQRSGEMGTLRALDHERRWLYWLTVRVSDGVHHTDKPLTVTVLDANDNSPVFSRPSYVFEFGEDTPRGSVVARVCAVDADSGDFGTVAYRLESTWGADVFRLDPSTGMFSVTGPLDYEEVEHYILTITARDLDPVAPRTTTTTVYMNLRDVNDNEPVFDPASYSAQIPEDIPEKRGVVRVTATDTDSGKNAEIQYSIVAGDDQSQFLIDATSGQITVAKPLDRETTPSYHLIVTATDQSDPPITRRSTSTTVLVTVTDVNDESPVFISPNSTWVAENSLLQNPVFTVEALDADEGLNSQVEYTMDSHTHFYINSSGAVFVKHVLDRESHDSYVVTVHATDKGHIRRSSSTNIIIRLSDANDNSPSFIASQYTKTISESIDVGSGVLKISATDKDEGLNAVVAYYIDSGDDNEDFALGPSSGILRVQKKLDYEQIRVYQITVIARDYGSPSLNNSVVVSITLTDVNDNIPVFVDSPYLVYVQENMKTHPLPVIQVSAHDSDSALFNKITYTLRSSDGHHSLFSIDTNSGEINILRELDRETRSEYELTVIAKDSGSPPLTGTGTIHVIVQDENDNDPKFRLLEYTTSVEENNAAVTSLVVVTATDNDVGRNSDITYSLLDDFSGTFAIDTSNGNLTTAVTLDRETNGLYNLVVVAMDKGLIPRSASVNVNVYVNDVNDNSPIFLQSSYVNTVSKLMKDDFVVGVLATDQDIGDNGRITYTVTGVDSPSFTINADNGVITAKLALVTGSRVYSLTVHASDAGSPSRSASASVAITIRSSSATTHPRITSSHQRLTLPESTNLSQIITTVIASSSSQLTYFIAGGNVHLAFAVDASTGRVTLVRILDYEQVKGYDLYVGVRDDSALTSYQRVAIDVTDVNDNAPIFSQSSYDIKISERNARFVVKVAATDADSGANGRVEFSIAGGNKNNAFSINSVTGEIRTVSQGLIDREKVEYYSLLVLASDQGMSVSHSTMTSVEVQIEDVNDSSPRFTRQFSISIPESAPVGSFVLRVTSSDDDLGLNAVASYSLSAVGNGHSTFAIDAKCGNITVNAALDAETDRQYVLEVYATDRSFRIQTTVTITISDVNDNPPRFNDSAFTFEFEELRAENSQVGAVSARDADISPPNNRLYFSLYRASPTFFISGSSGHIYCRRSLRYNAADRSANRHELIVVATDLGTPSRSSKVRVVINVVDANNNAPVFEKVTYRSVAPVNAGTGTPVIQVTASDLLDFGPNADVRYSVIGGNGSSLFSVNAINGSVTVATSLNGRRGRLYRLVIKAQDRGVKPLSTTARVFIQITAVNVYAPRFVRGSLRATVPEDQGVTHRITTFKATDYDSGVNGEVTYTITSGNDGGLFQIGDKSGELRIVKSLDYETVKIHRLGITVRDRALFYKESTQIYAVAVTDVNDNVPLFEKATFDAYIAENSPITSPVHSCAAADADSSSNAVIEYGIDPPGGLFTVDQAGVVRCQRELDYETRREYVVSIFAKNPGSKQRSEATLRIHVTGENEFLPEFIDTAYFMRISESAALGRFVGKVSATDADLGADGVVYYYLVGASNMKAFKIHRRTGEIFVSGKPDYEKSRRISLRIIAKNRGPVTSNNTAECTAHVSIQDANDPPRFTRTEYTASVREDAQRGTPVVSVTAIDDDRVVSDHLFTYVILGGNVGDAFEVDQRSGALSVKSGMDRERLAVYSVKVGAVDGGVPPQTGSAMVTVSLLDVNDNAPYFTPSQPTAYIPENKPRGTDVIRLIDFIGDADTPTNGAPFRFFSSSGALQEVFSIDSVTGSVVTRKELDREDSSEYLVPVMVEDSGVPPIRALLTFRVIVEDVADSPSFARALTVVANILADSLPSEPIGNVRALDRDVRNDQTCVIVNGDYNVFGMTPTCGLSVIDYPQDSEYTLRVRSNGASGDVEYTIVVKFGRIARDVYNDVVILRIKSKRKELFLSQNYLALIGSVNARLEFGFEASLIQITQSDEDLLIMVAVSKVSGGYMPKARVEKIIFANLQNIRLDSKCAIENNPVDSCERNMCKNSGECLPIIKTTNSLTIINTDHLIFSAPKIDLTYKCSCVGGYTGDLCETAKQLCGSWACKNGGKCVRPGVCQCPQNWQGQMCDVDVNECVTPECQNGGTCVNLPGSHRCDCLNGYTGMACEMTHRLSTFTDGSFVESSSLDDRYNNVSVRLSTVSTEALVLYNPSNETGDFLALEIIASRIRLSVRAGGSAVTRVTVPTVIEPAKWYKVTVARWLQMMSVKVEACVSPDHVCTVCVDGDTSCHALTTLHTSDGRVNISDGVLHIGGVRDISTLTSHRHVATFSFLGCLSVAVNGYDSVRETRLDASHVHDGCSHTPEDVCTPDSCSGNGQCVNEWTFTRCECTGGFKGRDCHSKEEVVTFASDVTVTYAQRTSYTQRKMMDAVSGRGRRSADDGHLSLRFAPTTKSGVLFYSANQNSYAALLLSAGHLHFLVSTADQHDLLTLDKPVINLAEWYDVIVRLNGDEVSMTLNGASTSSRVSRVYEFTGDDVTTIVLGGAPRDVHVGEKLIPGYRGCMDDFKLNHRALPFSGATERFIITVAGNASSSCSSHLAALTSDPHAGGLSTGVIVVIALLLVIVVVAAIVFVFYRKRKNLCFMKPAGDSRVKLSGGAPFSNGKLPHDIGSRSHDSGYGECNELTDDGDLNTHARARRPFELARPDIIESDQRLPSCLPLEIDDGTVIIENGDMLYHQYNRSHDLPECYDLENISTISPGELQYPVFHDDGPVPSQYLPNSPPYYHQLETLPDRHRSPVNGRGSARQSPCVPQLRHTPVLQTVSHSPTRPRSRNSPYDQYHPQMNPLPHQQIHMNQLSKHTGLHSRTSPLGLPRNMDPSPIEQMSYLPTHTNKRYSSSDHSMLSSIPPSHRRPHSRSKHRKNPYSGYRHHPKGLTIEEVDRLNSHRHSTSPQSALDAVSTTSDENMPPHMRSSHGTTSSATLLEHIESSSDESPNESFTCSEFEYGHDKLRNDRPPRVSVFSKLTEVENEDDGMFTPHRRGNGSNDGLGSTGDSYSTLPSSNDERTPPLIVNDSSAINWDYLLNWGPSFEKLVGVFRDIALLPDDAIQTKIIHPTQDSFPQLEEAYV